MQPTPFAPFLMINPACFQPEFIGVLSWVALDFICSRPIRNLAHWDAYSGSIQSELLCGPIFRERVSRSICCFADEGFSRQSALYRLKASEETVFF